MKLKYHNDWRGNFGDDLNIPFYESLVPEYKVKLPDYSLYGIGTLLNNVHGEINKACIVGAGYGYGESLEFDSKTTKIFGVRGPVTAEKLCVSNDLVIGDPAIFYENCPAFRRGKSSSKRYVVAMHHLACELWDFDNVDSEKFKFLDPGVTTIEDYIEEIRTAEFVFAESLHGAIIAATYNVPFIPISIFTSLEEKKWLDFLLSIEMNSFEYHKISQPEKPFIRDLCIKLRKRNIFTCNKNGKKLSANYIRKIENELLNLYNKNKFYESNHNVIASLQSRIGNAIDDFSVFLNKA